MKFQSVVIIFIALFLYSCGGINFVYDNTINQNNPIYNKTSYEFTGIEIPSYYRYVSKYIGTSGEPDFQLKINIEETKTKKSVKKNQAVSKLDYELKFLYILEDDSGCLIYRKNIFSRFSYVPKSSGYNFGSDKSLEKMYELAAKENVESFISFVSELNELACINEN